MKSSDLINNFFYWFQYKQLFAGRWDLEFGWNTADNFKILIVEALIEISFLYLGIVRLQGGIYDAWLFAVQDTETETSNNMMKECHYFGRDAYSVPFS